MINNRLCGGRCGGRVILATKTEESLPLRHITRHCEGATPAPSLRGVPLGRRSNLVSIFLPGIVVFTIE